MVTFLVFLVTITQWVMQTPELKAKFSQEGLEKTQKDIIDYSSSLYNDTSNYILVKSEETKKLAEETIE
jgi:cell division septal protein FtsQ